MIEQGYTKDFEAAVELELAGIWTQIYSVC